jgi:hypothetical protein
VTALYVEQSEEWVSGRRYLDLSDAPLLGRGRGSLADARGMNAARRVCYAAAATERNKGETEAHPEGCDAEAHQRRR